jgi:hypothetical protein
MKRGYIELAFGVLAKAIEDLRSGYIPTGKGEFCAKCFLTKTIHEPENIWGRILANQFELRKVKLLGEALGEHTCHIKPQYKTHVPRRFKTESEMQLEFDEHHGF